VAGQQKRMVRALQVRDARARAQYSKSCISHNFGARDTSCLHNTQLVDKFGMQISHHNLKWAQQSSHDVMIFTDSLACRDVPMSANISHPTCDFDTL
jgi:hypothetical protein